MYAIAVVISGSDFLVLVFWVLQIASGSYLQALFFSGIM